MKLVEYPYLNNYSTGVSKQLIYSRKRSLTSIQLNVSVITFKRGHLSSLKDNLS